MNCPTCGRTQLSEWPHKHGAMTPDRPRCEATVHRYRDGTGDHDASEADFRDEPCGRLAKAVVQVGSRDVPACYVHERKLRRGLL